MREWHSPLCGTFRKVEVVAGLSAWSRVFLRDLFSSACCVRFSSKTERPFFTSEPVCGGCFPGVGVDAQSFEVALADVLVPQLRASGRSLPCHQLRVTIEIEGQLAFNAQSTA